MAKQMVIAGLKWPPDVEAQVIIAKAMPRANAAPGFEGGGDEKGGFFLKRIEKWEWEYRTYQFGKYFQTQHFLD